jgi:hypothetical protein
VIVIEPIKTGTGEDAIEVDPSVRLLRVEKSNYGPRGLEIKFRLNSEGRLEVLDQVGTGLDRMAASAKAQRIFLSLLRAWTENGRPVSDRSGAAFAPALFAQDPRSEGVTSGAFRLAMMSLFASGQLRVEEAGPQSKRRRVIVEATPDG